MIDRGILDLKLYKVKQARSCCRDPEERLMIFQVSCSLKKTESLPIQKGKKRRSGKSANPEGFCTSASSADCCLRRSTSPPASTSLRRSTLDRYSSPGRPTCPQTLCCVDPKRVGRCNDRRNSP
ncbi:dcc family protein at1g52590 chloroplastic [Phtheirospermum japonicum]|uniref:Dcc family protein at1g52590 chloroplastic n=1 Tax=Phtheirospermum japonicum TaxID=374723 RepID=A0A830BUB3_9LAMI|nr:dcc family protein at1g52590 chloroplastic [Phtheirospermum japonicum]